MIEPIKGNEVFSQKLSEGNVIMEFSAPWCGYCRRLKPMVEKLSGEIPEPVYVINIDEDEDIAEKYEVDTIPTLIYFHDGQPVDRIVGYGTVGYPQLKEFVEKSRA